MARSRSLRMLAPLATLALILTACPAGGSSPAGGASGGASGGAGGSITVTSLWGGAEAEAFQAVLDAFKAKTGITVTYSPQRTDYATVLRTQIQGGTPPDVAIIPGIGFLRSFAAAGDLKKLSDIGLDRASIEKNYAPGILDVGTVGGDLYAIMVKLNSKSTIWYKPNEFEANSITVPKTWEDFTAVIDKLKAAGKTPLALGAKDSWTLTDWFESIYVRQAGPEAYDKLFSKDGVWTDKTVTDAITTMLSVLNDKNVLGGIDASLGKAFTDGIGDAFKKGGKAEMYYEGGFVGGIALGDVNKDLKIGTDIDFFDFPSINDEDAITIGGDVLAAFTDKPGVKEFMTYMTTAEAGTAWAKGGTIISPVKGVDTSVYPNDLAKKEAEQVANASAVRFDGSDLLPAGADLGAVLQGALQGQDVKGLLSDFQSTVTGAWEAEAGG
jgi:alpha-glucoside transport system substrate-binding protein